MKEVWRVIPGHENYEVSNMGRVRTVPKVKKLTLTGQGYYTTSIDGKCIEVHRLVAAAFLDDVEGKTCVDHINTIKTDNRVENLRWVTYSENINNPLTLKHISDSLTGCKNPFYGKHHSDESKHKMSESIKSKGIKSHIKRISYNGIEYNSCKECATAIGKSQTYVTKLLKNGAAKII